MIYYGQKASEILYKNLTEGANIFSKGYFKENNCWTAFDNYSGNCFVEEFSKEEFAIAWVENYFDMSEVNEFEIIKILRGFYYIKGNGFLKVKFETDKIKTKLFPL
jgi:hypothetical protein